MFHRDPTMPVVCCLLALLAPPLPSASAQHFHGHSLGHHHHDAFGHMIDDFGHHIDSHGHHTGALGVYHGIYGYSGYWGPRFVSPSYYFNNPVTVVTPTVTSVLSRPLVFPQPTTVLKPPVPKRDGGTIRLVNPKQSPGPVAYRLNGFPYDMKPAFAQSIEDDREWTIEFPSEGKQGTIRYRLKAGEYEFRMTDGGWDLFSVVVRPPAPEPIAPGAEPLPRGE